MALQHAVQVGTTNMSDQRLKRRILWTAKDRHAEILLQWRNMAPKGISSILTQSLKTLTLAVL